MLSIFIISIGIFFGGLWLHTIGSNSFNDKLKKFGDYCGIFSIPFFVLCLSFYELVLNSNNSSDFFIKFICIIDLNVINICFLLSVFRAEFYHNHIVHNNISNKSIIKFIDVGIPITRTIFTASCILYFLINFLYIYNCSFPEKEYQWFILGIFANSLFLGCMSEDLDWYDVPSMFVFLFVIFIIGLGIWGLMIDDRLLFIKEPVVDVLSFFGQICLVFIALIVILLIIIIGF